VPEKDGRDGVLLPITSATAAFLATLLLITAVMTVRQRLKHKVAFGDAGEQSLIAASRSHGNLAEHAPIVIILLGLLEYAGANSILIASVAGAFCFGRVMHVVGLHQDSVPGKAPFTRQLGVILTWLTILVLVVLVVLGLM